MIDDLFHNVFIFIIIDAYTSLGCWKDTSNRAIPTIESKNSLLDGSYQSRDDAIQKCFEAAKSFGYDVFGVQNGGWCASSATAESTYKKHGQSTACLSDGKGGPLANEVYEIKQGKIFSHHRSVWFQL